MVLIASPQCGALSRLNIPFWNPVCPINLSNKLLMEPGHGLQPGSAGRGITNLPPVIWDAGVSLTRSCQPHQLRSVAWSPPQTAVTRIHKHWARNEVAATSNPNIFASTVLPTGGPAGLTLMNREVSILISMLIVSMQMRVEKGLMNCLFS